MRVITFLVLALLSTTVFAIPEIQHWETKNGARVYFVQAPQLPMVDMRVVFDAGAARDGDKGGLALMTNGMMSEGAGKWDANAIAERFESVGAAFSNSSHRDMSVFSLRTLTDKKIFDKAVETFATVLAKPTFPEDAFARERKRLLVSLEHKKESPDALSDEAVFAALYGTHPYAHESTGDEKSVKALQRKDMVEFHKQYMVGKNAVVAIVGDLDRAQAEALAERIVGELASGSRVAALPEVAAIEKARTVKIEFPSTQSHVTLVQPGVKRGDPDYFPLYIGNHVLGGSGLVSILSDEIREKRGLSYSSYSYFSPMREKGPFIMALQTKNESRDEALKVMKQVLADFVKNGPTEKQLEASRKNLTGGFALQLDSNKEIMDQIAAIGFYNMPLDYLDSYLDKINSITLEQVKDAFRRRVDAEKLITVIVGNGAQEQQAAAK